MRERHLEKLYKGIRRFQDSYYKKERDFFKRLSKGQKPEALFITCVDSRVDPNLLTQSRPGELLTLRTPGNIIPPFGNIEDGNSSAGTLEFAVIELKVKDIILCGHSGCGAIEALYKSAEELKTMPHLKDWLQLAAPVRKMIERNYSKVTPESRQRLTEEENVLYQLHNVQTYPFVDQAVKEERLNLHGWYYDICKGDVYTAHA